MFWICLVICFGFYLVGKISLKLVMEGIFGSDSTKEIDDEESSDSEPETDKKGSLWLKIQKIFSTILMTLSTIFAGFIMDKSLGVFACTKNAKTGNWEIWEDHKTITQMIYSEDSVPVKIMDCYDSEHYFYGFFGILMVYFYYPTYLLIYPISQFKDEQLDVKIKPTFLILIGLGKLIMTKLL